MAGNTSIDRTQPSGVFTGGLLAEKEERVGGTAGLLDR
jgi:hypothetical protein